MGMFVLVVGSQAYENTQLVFTCSRSAIETLEKVVKYVQSQQ